MKYLRNQDKKIFALLSAVYRTEMELSGHVRHDRQHLGSMLACEETLLEVLLLIPNRHDINAPTVVPPPSSDEFQTVSREQTACTLASTVSDEVDDRIRPVRSKV